MAWNVRHLVSKKKKRYVEDGFDLDLSYIKPNIVAMGFPAEKLEGVYRNNIDEVARFLDTKHKDHYKLYNLCREKTYDESKFHHRVSSYLFDDHNAPPFELIQPFCEDMDDFLNSDPKNVAIVHCKAGKGRTGVMICAYLLHTRHCKNTKDALRFYGDARTLNNKGVTIPSQRRYVEYYGHFIRHNLSYSAETILISSFHMNTVPNINNGSCSPYFVIWQKGVKLFQSKVYEVTKKDSCKRVICDLAAPIPVCGDIKVEFYHKDYFSKERMFIFWFNTFFVKSGYTPDKPDGGGEKNAIERYSDGSEIRTFSFGKEDLDKANKDKKHKVYLQNFKLTANVIVPGTGSLDDTLCLSNEKLRDLETHSADITIDDDEDLSEPETNEWDDAEPDHVKRKTASKNATDLEVNETMQTQSGYVCSRV
ncbi:phosphatidylinositol 3,4,5-trisphosphate 3-phosphatase and dual-specificity protein phosphatase PTEN-like [Rhopilema esculentum]|uniref:phosphatidylinositol 3,4,5-trisphosphate 3-phosphatase and dual-specificity protein phosphatase PTEN-like n=1 Tax=Rhopilema esculentum TaxID=499914 RepID=UPI0031D1A289